MNGLRAIAEDGRSYVRHTDAEYDLISLEVGQVFRPGVAPFYTVEFYRDARERLRPGGRGLPVCAAAVFHGRGVWDCGAHVPGGVSAECTLVQHFGVVAHRV